MVHMHCCTTLNDIHAYSERFCVCLCLLVTLLMYHKTKNSMHQHLIGMSMGIIYAWLLFSPRIYEIRLKSNILGMNLKVYMDPFSVKYFMVNLALRFIELVISYFEMRAYLNCLWIFVLYVVYDYRPELEF